MPCRLRVFSRVRGTRACPRRAVGDRQERKMTQGVRRWGRRILVLATLMFSAAAFAQSYPSRPIRLVVPYGPVGLPDALARVVGQKVSETLGEQVVIDNKPGASGIIGAQVAAKAAPDGYTLFQTDNNLYAINPAVYPKLPY